MTHTQRVVLKCDAKFAQWNANLIKTQIRIQEFRTQRNPIHRMRDDNDVSLIKISKIQKIRAIRFVFFLSIMKFTLFVCIHNYHK